MSRLGGWLRAPAKAIHPSSRSTTANDEAVDLEDALSAAALIMNDDIDAADATLKGNESSFHLLGRGVTQFMKSVMGFEPEMMREASERLLAAENSAWADLRRAQKESNAFRSSIYPPGSEYALSYAMSQLMSAVVGVLNESLTESLKGFYKLRKAYATLDGLIAAEEAYTRKRRGLGGSSRSSLESQRNPNAMPGGFDSSAEASSRNGHYNAPQVVDPITNQRKEALLQDEDDDSDLEFVDAEELPAYSEEKTRYQGHVGGGNGENIHEKMNGLSLKEAKVSNGNGSSTPTPHGIPPDQIPPDNDTESDLFTHPIDIFVHSGTCLCFGMLNLILSVIPPVFTRLLSIIGFRGDRERGLQLLWRSTKYNNICGAVGGLALLGFYNGLLGGCDIQTDTEKYPDDPTGYPRARCAALLAQMRKLYPHSRLWLLEDARMYASNRELDKARATLERASDSKMKQISAINMFERSLNAMYRHDYQACAKGFQTCIELNNWSHTLYCYNAGAAYVDLYRDARDSNREAAEHYKSQARELLRKAPGYAGKKKFMAKQLPFDVFVTRKIQKWEERAQTWGVDFVDAIGVSPMEEMIYLWNGSKRMGTAELQTSLEKLKWTRTAYPEKHQNNIDESAMQALLEAAILRNLGRYAEARDLLSKGILNHDRTRFKGHLFDDWSAPSGHYEMAAISWFEKDVPDADYATHLNTCDEWLQKAARWETYVLDTRLGLRITTGIDTIRRYRELSRVR